MVVKVGNGSSGIVGDSMRLMFGVLFGMMISMNVYVISSEDAGACKDMLNGQFSQSSVDLKYHIDEMNKVQQRMYGVLSNIAARPSMEMQKEYIELSMQYRDMRGQLMMLAKDYWYKVKDFTNECVVDNDEDEIE